MKNIRILLIGFMIGGGLGAKIGAYLTNFIQVNNAWSVVELSTLIGIAIGCISSLTILLSRSGIFEIQGNEDEYLDQSMIAKGA